MNYYIKKNEYTYTKEFDKYLKENNLQAHLRSNSIIMCQMIFISDQAFFDRIGEQETKRYFDECYKFICNYNNLGEKNIISAVVHLDEGAPHMHLMFVSVVHIKDYDNTKKLLSEMKLELPEVPDITDISKFTIKRDEKILEKIIKPKDDLIKELYRENVSLNKELSKQSKVVDEAVKYQKERNTIMADNRALHLEVENIKKKYKEKETDMKWDYENEIKHLEKENSRLNKIIDKFYKTIDKFIEWICDKFNFGDSKELVKKFENEPRTFIDPVKQIKKEEREKDFSLDR